MYKNIINFVAMLRRLMTNSIKPYVTGRSSMSVQADSVINMKNEEIDPIKYTKQKPRANLYSSALNLF